MTEADLCEAFIVAARAADWTVYPEQGHWDILLQRRGIQVGIQAKLVADTHMLVQALPRPIRMAGQPGPHYRAVLFGRGAGRTEKARMRQRSEIYTLAKNLRLLVLQQPMVGRSWLFRLSDSNLRPLFGQAEVDWRYYRWRPDTPVWVPDFVPDLPAGVPAPRSVTPWALAACELEALWRSAEVWAAVCGRKD